MPGINPTRLRPSDLIRLVNSTPRGEVLTEAVLRRQRMKAGFAIGDRRTISLPKYAGWLTVEYLKPAKEAKSYDDIKEAARQRNAEKARAGRDIGDIPAIVNPHRKAKALKSFQYFCRVYFPDVFYLPFSKDHETVIERIEEAVLQGGLFALAMPRGSGKALALNTPLPTSQGWTTMGQVQVGDQLFDDQGRICRVIHTTDVMTDHPCYEVHFSDGERIVCDADHLWTVHDRYSRRNPLTLTTGDMARRVDLPNGRQYREKRYRIPLAKALQIPAVTLPIAPYALGVWLGDGNCRSARVTLAQWDWPHIRRQVRRAGEDLSLTSIDPDAHTCTGVLTRTYKRKSSFQGRLRRLNLLQNKHIPPLYLRAGYEQRLDLLQGLLDTDGYADPSGNCEIVIKYPKLADDFAELLSTLSIKYGRSEKYVTLNNQRRGPYHRFYFTVHEDVQAFSLPRKQNRLRPRPKTRPLSASRHILSIKPTDSVPVRCIQVDSPSQLYLAGRKMVPTHNTVLMQMACVWAALSGNTEFVCLVAASGDRAKDLLENIKVWFETNPLLYDDFPEVVYPIRALEGIVNRQKGQLYKGELTRIEWAADKIVLPTIEDSRACGVVISCSGLKGSDIRGQNHARADGKVVRPSLVMIDDPQTTESAWSESQSRRRESILAGDVLGMAGPGKKISGLMACTIIRPDDMADKILDREKHPEWKGQRTKMVYTFPENEKLWAEYAQLRADSLRNDGSGKEATDFYRQHRQAMDAGAVVAWPQRHHEDELSAIQHAMNLKFRDEAAFFAEYQNEPMVESEGDDMLSVEEIGEKLNGYSQHVVPLGCHFLTMFIDVQQKALFYLIAAWEENFTGYVIDYGTWPDQRRQFFTLRDMRRTIQQQKPKAGLEGAIYHALEQLTAETLGRIYATDDGTELQIAQCLIDANWGQSTDVVYQFCRQSPYSRILLPSHGKYVGASSIPFSEYKRKKGDRVGHHWRIPNTTGKRAVRHILIDTNYWKSFMQARLAVAMGDPGNLSLYGRDTNRHRLLAEHLTAEYRIKTVARDRQVDEWKLRPNRPDNHWLDCLVGAGVAASVQGVSLLETKIQRRPSKKIKLSEIQKNKTRL